VLEPFNAVNDPGRPLESLSTAEQNRALDQLAMTADSAIREATPRQALTPAQAPDVGAALRTIDLELSDTRVAFAAQARRRDDLVEKIERRLNIRPSSTRNSFSAILGTSHP